jgi:hypothetical protein
MQKCAQKRLDRADVVRDVSPAGLMGRRSTIMFIIGLLAVLVGIVVVAEAQRAIYYRSGPRRQCGGAACGGY